MAAQVMTTAEVAAELDTDPRTLRKFLRAAAKEKGDTTPGKGARWNIERKQLRSLRSQFSKWQTAQAEARSAREAAAEEIEETEDAELDS